MIFKKRVSTQQYPAYEIKPLPNSAPILAQQAHDLLNSPLLSNAFAEVYFNIHQSIDSLPTGDLKTLEQLKISLSVLRSIENSIKSHIDNALLSSDQE